jgi:putative aldouronate transport system permease protein
MEKRLKVQLWRKELRKNYELYFFVLPAVVSVFLFCYLPIYGIQIAFKDFVPARGIWGSRWTGLKWFIRFFSGYQFWDILRNTVLLSVYTLIFAFPVPIIFALVINQYRGYRLKKIMQTLSYAPHFISTVVLAGMITIFLSPTYGMYGVITGLFNIKPINPIGEPGLFRTIYVVSDIWQHMGWQSIIYMAALIGIDPELYFVAMVDGANRFQRIIHIELPALRPTTIIILILCIGNIMSLGFEKTYLLQNDQNIVASEVIATYVYKMGLLGTPQYSYSAAIGLFNSIVNMLLLVVFNAFSRKVSETSVW